LLYSWSISPTDNDWTPLSVPDTEWRCSVLLENEITKSHSAAVIDTQVGLERLTVQTEMANSLTTKLMPKLSPSGS
jgi:hypothetical protein